MFRLFTLRLMESYFRHPWLYLLPIILMLGAAYFSFSRSKPNYVASGSIFVQKESFLARLTTITDSNIAWQTPASLTVGELGELLQTDSFIRAIIKNTDLEEKMDEGEEAINETIKNVRRDVWVTALGNTHIRINAANEQPQIANQLVNQTIAVYLNWKINSDRAESEAAHTFFVELINRYKIEADLARQALFEFYAAHPVPIRGELSAQEKLEESQLQSKLRLAETRYANALDKDENTQLASAQAEGDVLQSYIIIDSPRLPLDPDISIKQTVMKLGIFLVAGGILSLVGIVGSTLLDRSFRFPIDVEHGISLSVLAVIPDLTQLPQNKKTTKHKKAKKMSTEMGTNQQTEFGYSAQPETISTKGKELIHPMSVFTNDVDQIDDESRK